jgi:hypothetical protein
MHLKNDKYKFTKYNLIKKIIRKINKILYFLFKK